jgi:NADH:ubiquinone oxidoreductase subunit 6 (subunit J)
VEVQFEENNLIGQISSPTQFVQLFNQQTFSDILVFSQLLYGEHQYLFVLLGFILLTAMVGAIVLAIATVEIPTTKK